MNQLVGSSPDPGLYPSLFTNTDNIVRSFVLSIIVLLAGHWPMKKIWTRRKSLATFFDKNTEE